MRFRHHLRSLGLALTVAIGCTAATPAPMEPAPIAEVPVLTQMVSSSHPDAQPWAFVPAEATGPGRCAATTVAAMLDQIRQGFPDVQDITNLKAPGPLGFTVMAGPAVRAGTSPPPPTGVASYIVALADDRSLAAIFFRGARCSGEMCQDRRYWYFETGANCLPRWVGYNHAVDHDGGPHGRCVDFEGASVWLTPGNPEPRNRCDADWSAQNISGSFRGTSIDPFGCGQTERTGNLEIVPIGVSITQGSDLVVAELSLSGTGIPILDGRSFAGKVERQSFTAHTDETVGAECPVHRLIDISLDFETANYGGVPGGFGVLRIESEAAAGCSPAPGDVCQSSMHLLKGDFPPP